jgi:hypothetical protein
MKVFISWSGDLSKRVAEVLKEWIPNVLQNAEPWMSSSDIDKGAIWFDEISSSLAAGSVGVICLTRDNVTAPWILFESGALAKGLTKARVCTFLIEANPSELKPPLSQFNATLPTKEEMVKLIKTINASDKEKAISDKRVEDAVEHWWPVFERKFKEALKSAPRSVAPKRGQEDMIEEILELVRKLESQSRRPVYPRAILEALPPGAEVMLSDESGAMHPVPFDANPLSELQQQIRRLSEQLKPLQLKPFPLRQSES